MIILTGKACSGKDTIKKELINKHNYINIITYTTRPKRKGEKDGVSYNFISEKEFKEKIEKGFFAEYQTYNVANGDIWYYGSSVQDIEKYENENAVIILTPDGVRDIMITTDTAPTVVYVYANQKTIVERQKKRGDEPNEAERRRNFDNKDFRGWEDEVDKIIYNNLDNKLEDVVQKILNL